MDYEREFFVERIDMETIMSIKCQLKQQQVLEPVLTTNLEYAARMPFVPTMLSGVTLCIIGECMLVNILLENSRSDYPYQGYIHFTVISNDGQPQLIRRVDCGDVIRDSDIKDVHFSGHNCQDMIKSCSQQARELVSQGKKQGITVLHIICNSLSLTYTLCDNINVHQSVVSQSPQTKQQSVINRHVLKTQCRLKFCPSKEFLNLLEIKCWLEQEKPHKRGLIACMDHLLKKFEVLPNLYVYGLNFILQSEGEIVELCNTGFTKKWHFIFGDTKGVSSYPANLEEM